MTTAVAVQVAPTTSIHKHLTVAAVWVMMPSFEVPKARASLWRGGAELGWRCVVVALSTSNWNTQVSLVGKNEIQLDLLYWTNVAHQSRYYDNQNEW